MYVFFWGVGWGGDQTFLTLQLTGYSKNDFSWKSISKFATNFAPILENTSNAGEGCAKQM